MRLSTVLKIAGVGILGYVGYRLLVKRAAAGPQYAATPGGKTAVAPRTLAPRTQAGTIGYIPSEGSLTSPGWNEGLYLGPEQTAESGRGAPAIWRTSEYIPAPGRSIAQNSVAKVWLPSDVFGQQNPSRPVEGDTESSIAAKVYQDASRPSSNAVGVPAWATAVPQHKKGPGPRTAPPAETRRQLVAARELGRAAGQLQNDVLYRATGVPRGQMSSRTVSAIFDKEMK